MKMEVNIRLQIHDMPFYIAKNLPRELLLFKTDVRLDYMCPSYPPESQQGNLGMHFINYRSSCIEYILFSISYTCFTLSNGSLIYHVYDVGWCSNVKKLKTSYNSVERTHPLPDGKYMLIGKVVEIS
jgi:hypothetical protein